MSTQISGAPVLPHTEPAKPGTPPADRWGTATLFARLARVDLETAVYWLRTVARPAHRMSHPFLSISNCPGCAYELAARPSWTLASEAA